MESLRLKQVHRFIKDPKQPIMSYYFSNKLIKYIKYDNTRPHYNRKLPKYYKNMETLVKTHSDILDTDKPKSFYELLINKLATLCLD